MKVLFVCLFLNRNKNKTTLFRKLFLGHLQKVIPYDCFKISPLVFTVFIAVALLALTGFKMICRIDQIPFVSFIMYVS